MSGHFVSVLLVCLLAATATCSSTKQGEHLKRKDFKLHLQKARPSSSDEADWPQRFDGQSRSGHRQSRASGSAPRPSSSDAVVQRLSQSVDLLSADVVTLNNQVRVLASQNEALQGNLTDLRSKNQALTVQLQQSAQTIQQQTTALEAVLAQFASFRAAVDDATRDQNQTLGQITQDVASLDRSLTLTQTRQNSTTSKLLTHDVTLHDLHQRMTSVENRTTRNAQDTETLQHWRANVTDDVSKISVTQTQLVSDVGDLEERGRQASGMTSQLGSQLSQLQQKLVSATRSIAFYARLSESTRWPQPPAPFPIILDEVLTNEGDAYNATSGNFTAPVEGDYFFAANSISSSAGQSQSPRIELMVDEDRQVLTDPNHPTLGAALRLRAGQRVWLRSLFTSRYGKGMFFTGYLIRPVIH